MGKCRECGRKGLFLKVGKDGLCNNCRLEQQHKERLAELTRESEALESRIKDSTQLLAEAKEAAKSEAQRQLEQELPQLQSEVARLNAEILDARARHDTLVVENEAQQKLLDTALKRNEKLKPLANSIKHAYEAWLTGEEDQAAYRAIDSLRLEDLLPQPDLNCLSMKQLKSRYTALRRQIVDVCTAYESRYTTKANATLYKLMVLALEAELENILHSLRFGKLEAGTQAVRALTSKYYQIAADGNENIARTLKRFVGQIESLYLEVVATEYEFYVQQERAREEQRAIKEQMRQEAEERKRLEQERKKVEAEESKYRQEIERVTAQMQQAHDSELEKLRRRLDEMNALISKVEERKSEIVNLQNGKAGTVYIISNIGSFGEHVFKVGMTRRLEPQDRVNELGDASVPFPFDVHSFIFSEDAVALETALHHELNSRRVNKVNLRKEFFDVDIEELRAIVERIEPTAPFKMTALAEQYRQSLSIDAPVEGAVPEGDDED